MRLFRTLILAWCALLGALTLQATAQYAGQAEWAGTSTGPANTYAITLKNYDHFAAGTVIKWIPNIANTGPTTVNVSTLGGKNLFKPTGAGIGALSGGELIAGQPVSMIYDGTEFVITSNTNASALQVTAPPQGYLTPCQVTSGSPVSGCTIGQIYQSGDVTAATSLFYEPAVGGQIPIWNGSNMIQTSFAELAITIPSSRLANTIYDVYVFNNGGTVTGCIGVAWTTSTAGSSSRGSGAGTAQIGQINGIWVNSVSLSCVNGASTFTIAANQGTMVGTILMDATNGQITNHVTWGSARKWSVANAYNQQQITVVEGDSTGSWLYSTNTIRQSNGNANNKITIVQSLAIQKVAVEFNQLIQAISDGNSDVGSGLIGVGLNSTTAFSGTVGQTGVEVAAAGTTTRNYSNTLAQFEVTPFIGANVLNALENGLNNGSSTSTFFGTQPSMRFKVVFGG